MFIGGSLVFPTSGSDLPKMTILAQSDCLTDHLK